MNDVVWSGGRYGLGSKDTPPSSVFAVYTELEKDEPKRRFTIGIADDVTNLSCPRSSPLPSPQPPAPSSASSGVWAATVPSAPTRTPSRSSATTPTSTFRLTSSMTPRRPAASPSATCAFGDKPIRSPYYINQADFVACHNPATSTWASRWSRMSSPAASS